MTQRKIKCTPRAQGEGWDATASPSVLPVLFASQKCNSQLDMILSVSLRRRCDKRKEADEKKNLKEKIFVYGSPRNPPTL